MEPRLLHVANGTSVTTTLEVAGIPGTMSIWADPLHDGPVPGGIDDDALMEVRRQHHAASPAAADPRNDMRQWRQVIANHDAYDELVLWFEHDLFDQLNLVHVLSFIREQVPGVRAHVQPSKRVSLICIGSFPGRPDFHGLGELDPSELASLFETRQPVTPEQYHLAHATWNAFRSPTPESLGLLLIRDLSPLPFLAPAFTRFLQEYPWVGDGLSRTERRLMTLAAEGRAEWPAVFPRMSEGEDAFYVTDTEFMELKDALMAASPALLVEQNGALALTAAGRDVLEGRADRVALCGLDRWFGGVHLQGHTRQWSWEPTRRRVVPW
jgi:hypothetical protein